MKNCNFSRYPKYPTIPKITLVTQNSARSVRSELALFEVTFAFDVWRARACCIMTATMMPAKKSPTQIHTCGLLAAALLALLRAARTSPNPFQIVAARKNGERQNGRYSGSRWKVGK